MKIIALVLACAVLSVQAGAESLLDRLRDSTNARKSNAKSIQEQINERHEKYVGKSEDDLIEELGAPDRVDNVGSYKIYYYITNRGVTSESVGTNFGRWGVAEGKSKAHGQTSRFYFKGGKVTKWDYDSE